MKTIQKHTIIFSGLALCLLLVYAAFQNFPLPQSGEAKHTLSQSGKIASTEKQSQMPSTSKNQWGTNPFGTGAPITEQPKKWVFQKPNTEWKTRTLSGVTYIFGEGNPKEVALTIDQIQEMNTKCQSETDIKNHLVQIGICNPESGLMYYVMPETEKRLLLALSDPNWIKLATECEKNFRNVESSNSSYKENGLYGLYFDKVFAPGFLNIENFLSVEPNTGYKLLNVNMLHLLRQFLSMASDKGYRSGDYTKLHGDCVDRYGTEIARNISITIDLYRNSLEHTHGYTNSYLLSEKFNLSDW